MMEIETKNGREIQNSQRLETLSQFFLQGEKKGTFLNHRYKKIIKLF